MISKYTKIYKSVKTKKEFVEMCIKKYDTKEQTANRRWYDETRREKKLEGKYELKKKRIEKKINIKKEKDTELQEIQVQPRIVERMEQQETTFYIPEKNLTEPDKFKLITVQDMINSGYNPSRAFLKKFGFTDNEVEWLIKHNYINNI